MRRPKIDIALELHPLANGLPCAWLTFDEGHGKSVELLNDLHFRGQHFVAEVPVTCTAWIEKPRTTTWRRPTGGFVPKPRLVQKSRPFRVV